MMVNDGMDEWHDGCMVWKQSGGTEGVVGYGFQWFVWNGVPLISVSASRKRLLPLLSHSSLPKDPFSSDLHDLLRPGMLFLSSRAVC